MITLPTKDIEIRNALKRALLNQYSNHTDILIIEELGLRHGAARIDIALVNGELHGFELKSDSDTLMRLPEQVRLFNTVLDKITLVVGWKHLKSAIKLIPKWWGVKTASKNEEEFISFNDVRAAKINPICESLSIAKLLWKEEALSILSEIGKDGGVRSKTRLEIYKRLSESVNFDYLRKRVREHLKVRQDWRLGQPQKSCGD